MAFCSLNLIEQEQESLDYVSGFLNKAIY